MVGRTVSHYRVLALLGTGGMGTVYEAEDTRLGRRVALKFLPADLARDRHALERFQREARAASALNHPHICTIHDIDEAEGQPFIAMEFLQGKTLRQLIQDHKLDVDQIPDLGVQIADGLDTAHQRGIIHRDLKPANIFVTDRGTAKILDFGLAKLKEEPRAPESAVATTATEGTLTSPGAAVGTIAYMSPEQVRGETLDARTDLFSMGVVLYEMATGKRPFDGATSGVVFDGILNRAPTAPTKLNVSLPDDLERIIALDPESSQAHWLRGALCHKRGDLQEAVRHHKRALAIDPGDVDAMYWLTYAYRVSGKASAARPWVEKLVAADPLTPYSYHAAGWIDFFEGQSERASESFRKMYELDPESPFSRWDYAFNLAARQRDDEASSLFELVARDTPTTFFARHGSFLRFALKGDRVGALQAMTGDLARVVRLDDHISWMTASYWARIDERTAAMEWLENAVRLGFINYPYLSERDPFLAKLRGEARFQELVARVKREWEAFEV